MNIKKHAMLLFFLHISCLVAQQDEIIEVGKDDGGEYCRRVKGGKQGGMFFDGVIKHDTYFTADQNVQEAVWVNPDMNFQDFRNHFPILQSQVQNHPFIYFDSASTAQMPQVVLDAITDYYQNYKSNVGRGLYDYAEHATAMFEDARVKVAGFIGAKKQEIIFTSGATQSINLACHIWAAHHIKHGDEIVISEVEHNANFIPWKQLAERNGAKLIIVPLNEHGMIDASVLKTYLSKDTKLVAVTHQSNILGSCNDIAAIAQAAHQVGAKVLIDCAQSIAHQKINVSELDCDFLAFSGHKLFGPTGVGVLFVKESLFDQCVLHNFGGGAVMYVSLDHIDFKLPPHCFEPGTQPIAEVIGLGAAIDFVQQCINFKQVQAHETALVRYLAHELKNIPGISLVSPIPQEGHHSNMVTFTIQDHHAYDVAYALSEYGIAVRCGFHCVQPYHDKLGGNASIRVSLSAYNTLQEAEFFIKTLKLIIA